MKMYFPRKSLKTFRPTVVIRTHSFVRFVLIAAHALLYETHFILGVTCVGSRVRTTRHLIVPEIVWKRESQAEHEWRKAQSVKDFHRMKKLFEEAADELDD